MRIAACTLALMSMTVALASTGCSTAQKEPSKETRIQLLSEAATASYREGDVTATLNMIDQAEKLGEISAELTHLKALAYYGRKEPVKALGFARRAVELKPKYSDAKNTTGKILLDLGRFSEAEGPLTEAAEDPLYVEAYKALTNLGILFYRLGDHGRAEKPLQTAVERMPTRACHAHYYLGHVHMQRKEFSKATVEYERATQRFCASFSDAHLAQGIALERNRDYDKARAKFLDITKTFPNTSVANQAMERLRYLP